MHPAAVVVLLNYHKPNVQPGLSYLLLHFFLNHLHDAIIEDWVFLLGELFLLFVEYGDSSKVLHFAFLCRYFRVFIEENTPFFELIPLLITLKPRLWHIQKPYLFIVRICEFLNILAFGYGIPRFRLFIPNQSFFYLPVNEILVKIIPSLLFYFWIIMWKWV